MKFQVGDRVLILHSNEEGEVVDVINNKMVMVDVKGVKFPAYIDQLDFPYFKRFSEKKLFPDKKAKKFIDEVPTEKKSITDKIIDGIWLTFIPVMETDEFGDEVVDILKVQLENRTAVGYKFIYRLNYFGTSEFELPNQVHAFEDFYLHDIPFADLNDSPSFNLEFSLLTPDKNKADYYEASLKLKPKQLFSRIEELKKKAEATFSYKLMEEYPGKVFEDKPDLPAMLGGYKVYDASKGRQHLEPAKHVLDLHIEKLIDNWKTLSNFEMLTLQLKTLEKYADLAMAHRQPSMIVIHGVGTGKLRDEIHELLRLRNDVKTFINQFHPAYGFGATEVFFKV